MRDYEQCRPYIDHWLAEHRRLHGLIRKAHAAIMQTGGPDRDACSADVAGVLRRLREELVHHFAEEEAGGCMDEAVSHCPHLAAEVTRIEAEHGELLAQLDRLIAQALDLDNGGNAVAKRVAFEHALDDLCQQLHAHEAAENAVLQHGFGTSFNGDEIEKPAVILDV
jgi:iron-sulfur cluster repair protein YtfE (RIC family)